MTSRGECACCVLACLQWCSANLLRVRVKNSTDVCCFDSGSRRSLCSFGARDQWVETVITFVTNPKF